MKRNAAVVDEALDCSFVRIRRVLHHNYSTVIRDPASPLRFAVEDRVTSGVTRPTSTPIAPTIVFPSGH
jgi:hypothetical protein